MAEQLRVQLITMKYKAEFNGNKRRVETADEWRALLHEVRQADQSALSLRQIKGRMKGFERFLYGILGLTTDIEGHSAILLTRGGTSALTFADEAGHELRVIGGKIGNGNSPVEAISFHMGDGSVSTHPVEECLPRDEALRALAEFYGSGRPPQWLSYRKVR